jgi:hypothetical protein
MSLGQEGSFRDPRRREQPRETSAHEKTGFRRGEKILYGSGKVDVPLKEKERIRRSTTSK